jgi:phosphatidylserine/phosphatidylglycerophosphate/cardiolipin synthase-like enzyme
MTRVIYKARDQANQEVIRMFEALFVAELASPSQCLWVASPWISDVPLIDNTTGDYQFFADSDWREIPLSEVLVELCLRGSQIVVATTDDPSNKPFLETLKRLFYESELNDRLIVNVGPADIGHRKLIVGDDFVVSGSMNFTFRGLFVREEMIELKIDAEDVEDARLFVHQQYGGSL